MIDQTTVDTTLRARRRWRTVLAGVLVVLAGAGVSLLRHPGTVALDTVYAEDGTEFLADAVHGPAVEALVTSYAGYFHVVPRLLGALAAVFPAQAAAAVLAVSAALVTAALALLVYVAAGGHLASPLARVLVAAPVVVAPLAQHEVPNSVANLHWPALYAVFWMLIWTPHGRTGRVVAPVVVALTALSDILVVAFLPLAAMRLYLRRDRASGILAGVLAAGVVFQAAGLFTGSSSREVSLDPVQPVSGFVLRAVPAALFGERWLPDAGADPRRLALAALAWLLLAAAVAVAARGISSPRWGLAVNAAAHSVILYVLPVVLTGVAPPRYAFAPALLLLTALVALLSPAPAPDPAPAPAPAPDRAPAPGRADRRLRRAVPLLVLAVAYTAVCVAGFRVDTPRAEGPRWSDELDRARAECEAAGADPVEAADTDSAGPDSAGPAGADTVEVTVIPDNGDWIAVLPCDYTRR